MVMLDDHCRNSPILCGMFDRLNRRYFRGSLPSLPVMWHRPLLSGGRRTFAGQFVVMEDGEHANIIIDPKLQKRKMWSFIESTLLHEMVHAYLWNRNERPSAYNGHGKKFQKEMQRLARVGAFDRLW